MTTTKEHVEHLTLHVSIVDPDHGARNEAPQSAFEAAKRRLKDDGHFQCYVSGCQATNLQVHHFLCEWSEANDADMVKVKALSERFDPYGYGKLLAHRPIESPDDIRNMLVLCQSHHTGVNHATNTGIGIHYQPAPAFFAQLVALDGANPVPQQGETEDQALKRVKSLEAKG